VLLLKAPPCQYRYTALPVPELRPVSIAASTRNSQSRAVKTHVENIYKKLGASTRAEAVKLAESAGFLPHA
jgi:hypothetical protein